MKDQTIESLPTEERNAIESHLGWLEAELGDSKAAEEFATRVLIRMGPQQTRETRDGCPRCGSSDLEPVNGNYETGVEMNGYRERFYEEGLECHKCGLFFDEEPRDSGFEAFCQEESEL